MNTRKNAGRLSGLVYLGVIATVLLLMFLLWVPPPVSAHTIQRAQGKTSDTLSRRFVAHSVKWWEQFTDDFLMWSNRPGTRRGKVNINRLGMRGPEYPLSPARNTYRIALLGSSMTLGLGVPFEQTFASIVEQRLNREAPGVPRRRYEILNFSVGAYSTLQQVGVMDRKVLAVRPDVVLVGVFSVETGRMTDYLSQLVKTGYPIPYPYVEQAIRRTGATASMERPEFIRRLSPISEEIVKWSYQHLADVGRKHGFKVVGVVLPEPRPRPRGRAYGDIDVAARLAASAGLPLLDLRGMYDGENVDSLRLGGESGANPHWNARGHRLAADKFFSVLRANDARTLQLGFRN
ncbi:MAG TPA: SGNH/GDSL hydrolase family protein [Gemmatimonadaceae bacterium]|nr:SGNH/GDSL hydrolase family protein [Gemmatimonadaceae bacterium]